jgi:hypothetical protein
MALAADLLRQRRTDPILQIDRTNGAFIPTARKQNALRMPVRSLTTRILFHSGINFCQWFFY